jgi:sugar (pentulose or hexulose) kinase
METVDEVIKIQHSIEPRPKHAARYDALYQEYREMYTALSPIYRRLHKAP